jgi:hypothetical protein
VQDREKGEWVCGKISAGTITAMREQGTLPGIESG